jgi:hypothetical protein
LWAIILAVGLFFLPESPRYFVKNGEIEKATHALAIIRGQPPESDYIADELNEIIANYEWEKMQGQVGWIGCFSGSGPSSPRRRVMIGIFLQMFQQLTG